MGLDYILMALAPCWRSLLVGRIISGITAASFATAFAYIADVTPPEQRAGAFGMVGVALRPRLRAGACDRRPAGQLRSAPAVLGAAAACLINAAFGWFVLPELLPPERRMALQPGSAPTRSAR